MANLSFNIQFNFTIILAGLKILGNDYLQLWPCQSSHRLTVSLDGVEPLTVTLPYPILPNTITATLYQMDGIIDIIAAKALNELWPEDVIREQFRWNANKLDPWIDKDALSNHFRSQFQIDFLEGQDAPIDDPTALMRVRAIIGVIFHLVTKKKIILFELRVEGLLGIGEWYIRAHPPFRTSPQGTPILLLSALDMRYVSRRHSSKTSRQCTKEFQRIFTGRDLPKKMKVIHFRTAEEVRLFRHILRLNSTKIQPTSWQKENVPRSVDDGAYLATFIRPLYYDGLHLEQNKIPVSCCSYCGKQDIRMKLCARCKSVSYCSAECQRSAWSTHKLSCKQS